MLSQCDINLLLELINEKRAIVTREVKAIHEAKLLELGIQQQIKTQFVNKRRQRIDKREAVKLAEPIFNLSSWELSETETRLLSKGLKFGIKAKRVDEFEILARFEVLTKSLDYLEISDKTDQLRANLNSKSNFFQQLQEMFNELAKTCFIKLAKTCFDSIDNDELAALISLAKDKSIIISKADKGNVLVIQDSTRLQTKSRGYFGWQFEICATQERRNETAREQVAEILEIAPQEAWTQRQDVQANSSVRFESRCHVWFTQDP